MPKILNFGSLNIDYVYDVEHIVRAGETLSSGGRSVFCGGKGLNQSIALVRAGASVYHAGAVGAEDGHSLIGMLNENGVNTELVAARSCPSGHTVIQVDRTGQNSILLFGGANRTLTETEIDRAVDEFSAGDILLLQNEVNNVGYIIFSAKEKGMTVYFNPSPVDDDLKSLPLGLCDCLILNEIEAAGLVSGSGETAAKAAASYRGLHEQLTTKYPNTAVILTLGADGALCGGGVIPAVISQPAFKAAVADTTAAGDTFTGFFLACAAAGETLETSMRVASKAASVAVSRKGAASSIPWKRELALS